MRHLFLWTASLLLLGGCKSTKRIDTVPVSPAPDFQQLREIWTKALESKDLPTSISLYEHDAEFLNPDGSHAIGVKEIGELYQAVFATFDSHITMTSRGTGVSSAYAYDSGSYTETLTNRKTSVPLHVSGDYLTLYTCITPDHCLITRQVWTEKKAQ